MQEKCLIEFSYFVLNHCNFLTNRLKFKKCESISRYREAFNKIEHLFTILTPEDNFLELIRSSYKNPTINIPT